MSRIRLQCGTISILILGAICLLIPPKILTSENLSARYQGMESIGVMLSYAGIALLCLGSIKIAAAIYAVWRQHRTSTML